MISARAYESVDIVQLSITYENKYVQCLLKEEK